MGNLLGVLKTGAIVVAHVTTSLASMIWAGNWKQMSASASSLYNNTDIVRNAIIVVTFGAGILQLAMFTSESSAITRDITEHQQKRKRRGGGANQAPTGLGRFDYPLGAPIDRRAMAIRRASRHIASAAAVALLSAYRAVSGLTSARYDVDTLLIVWSTLEMLSWAEWYQRVGTHKRAPASSIREKWHSKCWWSQVLVLVIRSAIATEHSPQWMAELCTALIVLQAMLNHVMLEWVPRYVRRELASPQNDNDNGGGGGGGIDKRE